MTVEQEEIQTCIFCSNPVSGAVVDVILDSSVEGGKKAHLRCAMVELLYSEYNYDSPNIVKAFLESMSRRV